MPRWDEGFLGFVKVFVLLQVLVVAGEERKGSSIVTATDDCVLRVFGMVLTAERGGDEGEG